MKCECCDEAYGEVSTLLIKREYEGGLVKEYKQVYASLGLKGRLALIGNDEFICAFHYVYANKKEEGKAKKICEAFDEASFNFHFYQLDIEDVSYKYLTLA